MYGVYLQPVTNDTSFRNLNLIGDVVDIDDLMDSKGGAKSFCDGQVSATPPRYADDGMNMLFFESREVAEEFSRAIRGDLMSRIDGGEIIQPTPIWGNNFRLYADNGAMLTAIRSNPDIPSTFTDSQIETAIDDYMLETGKYPTDKQLVKWIQETRNLDIE